MLCDNCGKREANVRYSENINGRRKELNLCEECSKKLGIGQMDFSMPIDFSSFLGGFMDGFETPELIPMINQLKAFECDSCGYTFDDIVNTGKLGCQNCYDVFEDRLDPIIRRIQGSNHHVGRIGKIVDNKINDRVEKKEHKVEENKKNKEQSKMDTLQEELKKAIKEERYEDAAKIRDEIKKLENRRGEFYELVLTK